jgi:hypothetical protein
MNKDATKTAYSHCRLRNQRVSGKLHALAAVWRCLDHAPAKRTLGNILDALTW